LRRTFDLFQGGKNKKSFNKCKRLSPYDDEELFNFDRKGLGAKYKECQRDHTGSFSLNLHFPLERGKWSDCC
jgi:hypothetical protein